MIAWHCVLDGHVGLDCCDCGAGWLNDGWGSSWGHDTALHRTHRTPHIAPAIQTRAGCQAMTPLTHINDTTHDITQGTINKQPYHLFNRATPHHNDHHITTFTKHNTTYMDPPTSATWQPHGPATWKHTTHTNSHTANHCERRALALAPHITKPSFAARRAWVPSRCVDCGAV